MSLVIKSWAVNSSPPSGEPHVRIVGRESGLFSFVLSLLGIDATTTFVANGRHIEHESGSLSGFQRRITPMEHISTTYYGHFKPWKSAVAIAVLGFLLGGGAGGVIGSVIVLIGLGLAGVYYVLHRELTLGYVADCGLVRELPFELKFKRSVIEGQEINENSLRDIITLIEHLIKPIAGTEPMVVGSGRPVSDRIAGSAPTSVKELVTPAATTKCPSCQASTTPEEMFCGNCGHKLR